MINVSSKAVKEVSREITPSVDSELKTVKTKNKSFDQILKKNVSNGENVKQSEVNTSGKSTETDNVKDKQKKIVKDDSPDFHDEKQTALIENELSEEDLTYLSQLLGTDKIALVQIFDKLNLNNTDLSINSPKIDLFMIIKENLEGNLDEDSSKLLNSLKECMPFDIFSLEDFETCSNEDILDGMKSIAKLKSDLLIKKYDHEAGKYKFATLNDNEGIVANKQMMNMDVLAYDNIEARDSDLVKSNIKEDEFLKNLLKPAQASKANIDETKVAITIDKLNDMINSNKFTTAVSRLNINIDNFDDGIVKSIKFMDLANMKELTLKVIPKELGEIIIKVTLENGVLKANIKPTTKEGYELIQNNLSSIKDKLDNSSVKIQDFSVDVYDQNTTASNNKNFKDNNSRENNDSKLYNNRKDENNIKQNSKIKTDIIDEMVNMLA